MTGKHKGSTLLGLVIGIVGGLGVALAVAVYITKVPVPLTTKSIQHSPESDAAEIRKNKDWNPNAPLAGKSFVRSNPVVSGEIASGDVSPPAPPVPDPVRVLEPVTKKVPKPVVTAQAEPAIAPVPAKPAKTRSPESSNDELGQFIAAVPAKPAKPAATAATPTTAIPAVSAKPAATTAIPAMSAATGIPAIAAVAPAKSAKSGAADPIGDLARNRSADLGAPDPFTYFIQAGAFRTPEEAEKQRTRLQTLGMASRVTEREQAGRMVYRVRVGPFDKKDEADKMKNKMEGQSMDAALVRVQR
jgi:hypothetical protein